MATFEFMMILTAIIIALALTEILAGCVRILRGELRAWWVHSTFAIAGFIGVLQLFWDLYDYRDHPDWLFSDLLLVWVAPCVIFYLAAALLFPGRRADADDPIDLRDHYEAISRTFFLVLIPLMPIYALTTLRMQSDITAGAAAYRYAFFAIYLVLAATRNATVHRTLAAVHLAALAFFVASDVIRRNLVT